MAKNPELKAYSGYITQEQEDNLLIYCEKNNITKAKAIGLLIDSIDFKTLKAKKSRLENLELDFTEYKESSQNKITGINHRLYEIEKTLFAIETNSKNSPIEKNKTCDRVEINNKGITRQELATLLDKSPRTIENHSKDIEIYTKKEIGIAYKYDVKTKLYYPTND
jgi:hypothetical protein